MKALKEKEKTRNKNGRTHVSRRQMNHLRGQTTRGTSRSQTPSCHKKHIKQAKESLHKTDRLCQLHIIWSLGICPQCSVVAYGMVITICHSPCDEEKRFDGKYNCQLKRALFL